MNPKTWRWERKRCNPEQIKYRWLPLPAELLSYDELKQMKTPKGYTIAESWGALNKSWAGYKKAKEDGDEDLRMKYALQVQSLQNEMGIAVASFPSLGLKSNSGMDENYNEVVLFDVDSHNEDIVNGRKSCPIEIQIGDLELVQVEDTPPPEPQRKSCEITERKFCEI